MLSLRFIFKARAVLQQIATDTDVSGAFRLGTGAAWRDSALVPELLGSLELD